MRHFIVVILIYCCHFVGYSQQTTVYTNPTSVYQKAVDLFDKEKYGAALHEFEAVLEAEENRSSELYANASFYKALSALKLFNRNAEFLLEQFIINYPESPKVKEAYFLLGRYNYRKHNWKKVLAWYEFVDEFDLNAKDKAELFFRSGYAQFQLGNTEEASRKFYEIKDVDNWFYAPANYYYAHIAYENGQFETALNTFKRLENDPKFAVVIPYYISQILFLQEKYAAVIEYASPLLEMPKLKREAEIARIIGEAYYQEQSYQKAIPFLERYKKEGTEFTRDDNYQLAFAYYKTDNHKKAIDEFSKLIYAKDELAQISAYYLADCYIQTNKKKAAKEAFKKAYQNSFDEEITEEAFFSYAKLAYELSFDPYSEAVKAFLDYLDQYPNSDRADLVNDYLVNIYLSSKNYSSAIASLENIANKSVKLKEVYQQLLFNSAIEAFQNKQYQSAISKFEKSLVDPVNQELTTLSHYWIGEANYRLGDYKLATDNYTTFIFKPQAILFKEFQLAHYGLGYAFFKNKDYKNSAKWFRKYVDFDKYRDSVKTNDAYIRVGDAYFITKDYYISLEYYQKAIEIGLRDVDYALYQFAMAQGVLKNTEKQIELLKQLVAEYPKSNYNEAAEYQLGRTFTNTGDYEKALSYFNAVIEKGKYSSFRKKALLGIGTLMYNQGRDNEALTAFKTVVEENQNYADSKEAISGIENIYAEQGNIDGYEQYINQLSFMDISDGALDSLNYESAERTYMNGNCEKAIEQFEKYLKRFDHPIFKLSANFYSAECLFKKNLRDQALLHFNEVLSYAYNRYTEPAAVKAAYINYQKQDYQNAFEKYQVLLEIAEYSENQRAALVGLSRTAYEISKFDTALKYTQEILEFEKLNEALMHEAWYLRGQSFYKTGSVDSAMVYFELLSENAQNREASEAQYLIAQYYFNLGDLSTAENQVFELVNKTPSYENWLAKGLILLSDIYVQKEDYFQAQATLQSIVVNFEGEPGILEKAQQKLEEVKQLQQPKETKEKEPMEIDMGDNGTDNDVFFEEETPVEESVPTEKGGENE